METLKKTPEIAILVSHGFEEIELTSPRKALETAGYTTSLVSPAEDQVQANNHRHQGKWHKVDLPLKFARAENFDALLIPGGLFSPDSLRRDLQALDFVRHFLEAGKPVFAICHGPQLLISAGVLSGRKVTGFYSIQQDLANAGALVLDQPVVVDCGLVTSREPADLDFFNRSMIEQLRNTKLVQTARLIAV